MAPRAKYGGKNLVRLRIGAAVMRALLRHDRAKTCRSGNAWSRAWLEVIVEVTPEEAAVFPGLVGVPVEVRIQSGKAG